nr:MAG TPA: hypothetical protein [Caudoviricetes sp.]DAU59827.1 MAG TPA: hypothetical protein [Caudoviricetes sp.]DAV50849.1 MAG TPA: hypothetical protein [Caudoviricetes sp.]
MISPDGLKRGRLHESKLCFLLCHRQGRSQSLLSLA